MKKVLFMCMLCMLTLGANAQTKKTTRTTTKKTTTTKKKTTTTQATASFKNVNDFYKWIDGKKFKGGSGGDIHTFVFSGFWNSATNAPTTSGAKIMDGSLQLSEPYGWEIESGKAWSVFEEYNGTITINKAKKTLTIEPNGGVATICYLVDNSTNNDAVIEKELAKYIKNWRKNANVVLAQKAKSQLADSSWPEISCPKGDLGEIGDDVVVKKVGNNAYRFECTCFCGEEKYVDNWTIYATYANGKVKITSFGY